LVPTLASDPETPLRVIYKRESLGDRAGELGEDRRVGMESPLDATDAQGTTTGSWWSA
jgi:hypothetical protein